MTPFYLETWQLQKGNDLILVLFLNEQLHCGGSHILVNISLIGLT